MAGGFSLTKVWFKSGFPLPPSARQLLDLAHTGAGGAGVEAAAMQMQNGGAGCAGPGVDEEDRDLGRIGKPWDTPLLHGDAIQPGWHQRCDDGPPGCQFFQR
jgi:hypothetical protein